MIISKPTSVKIYLVLGLFFVLASIACSDAQAADIDLPDYLRKIDQQLLWSIHHGGTEIWKEKTSPDFEYVEEGQVVDRQTFLSGLTPDNADVLQIVDFNVNRLGDTAIVTHRDSIPANDCERRCGGSYLMTETWQRLQGNWKLRLVHIDAVHTPPPAIALSLKDAAEISGTYRHGADTYELRVDGGRLIGKRSGGAPVQFIPESRDVFYIEADLRSRRIFERDDADHVVDFVRRDENSDTRWVKDR